MAMIDSVGHTPSRLVELKGLVEEFRLKVQEWMSTRQRYSAHRRELLLYSPHELEQMGIVKSNIDNVAKDLAIGRPTLCRVIEVGNKRVLTKG